jgi:hypothetical protein
MTLVVNTLRALFDGVAQRLAADADPVLNIAWQASSKYAAGVRGIYPGPKLPTDPDEVIVLSPRQLTADPTLADSEYALNARFRGTPDPHTVWSLASAMRDVFLGRWSTVITSARAGPTTTSSPSASTAHNRSRSHHPHRAPSTPLHHPLI